MDFLKKTIVLSNKKDNYKSLAVLTIYKSNVGIFGALKCYDLGVSSAILGISVDNKQSFKQNVEVHNGKTYNFKLDNSFNLGGKIGCVMVVNEDNKIVPLVYGSSENTFDYKSKVIENLNKSINSVYRTIKPAEIKIKNDSKPEIEIKDDIEEPVTKQNIDDMVDFEVGEEFNNEIKKQEDEFEKEFASENSRLQELVGNNSSGLEDKKEMVELEEVEISAKPNKNAELFEYDEEQVEKEIDEAISNENHKFFNMISEQIDELFVKYPRERKLEELIEESKWVKVDFENDGHYYVIGLIYENGNLQYVCYGVLGTYSVEPPKELESYSQWLPLNPNMPESEGYWIMYQDADTGESINLNN